MNGCGTTAPPQAAQSGTVILKDGSSFSGTITKNSTTEITMVGPGGESRTYPMGQVASVQFSPAPVAAGQPPAAPAAAARTSEAPHGAAQAPASTPAPVKRAAAKPPEPAAEFRTIPSGTTIQVRNNELIDSKAANEGDTFTGVVVTDVTDSDGKVAIPRGSNATLVVRAAAAQGKIAGRSQLAVDVGSVEVGGRQYRLETSDFVEQGREGLGANKRTGILAGGGAALGGIIGAVAGGGKGAAIGALSGGGAGAATQVLTRGQAVKIPSETVLSFKLEAPVKIRELR